jgi:hypothetical protein
MRIDKPLHICLGTPPDHLDHLIESGQHRAPVYWTINADAQPGDEVSFYLKAPVSSIVAAGVVESRPERQ